jgi:hypothetical protein
VYFIIFFLHSYIIHIIIIYIVSRLNGMVYFRTSYIYIYIYKTSVYIKSGYIRFLNYVIYIFTHFHLALNVAIFLV